MGRLRRVCLQRRWRCSLVVRGNRTSVGKACTLSRRSCPACGWSCHLKALSWFCPQVTPHCSLPPSLSLQSKAQGPILLLTWEVSLLFVTVGVRGAQTHPQAWGFWMELWKSPWKSPRVNRDCREGFNRTVRSAHVYPGAAVCAVLPWCSCVVVDGCWCWKGELLLSCQLCDPSKATSVLCVSVSLSVNGENNSTHLKGLLWRLNELTAHIKYLEKCLVSSKCFVNIGRCSIIEWVFCTKLSLDYITVSYCCHHSHYVSDLGALGIKILENKNLRISLSFWSSVVI